MKNCMNKIFGSKSATAKVVDGTLVLSLPYAVTPVVWRMDLGFVRASALEVRDLKDGKFGLTLKTPKEDVHDVALFDTKNQAIEALMAVSTAMENAQGQIKAGNVQMGNTSEPKKKGKWRKILAIIVGLILLYIFVSILVGLSLQRSTIEGNGSAITGQTSSQSPAGVPLSADDFLQNR